MRAGNTVSVVMRYAKLWWAIIRKYFVHAHNCLLHSQNVSLPTCTCIMNHSIPAPTAKNKGRVLNTPSHDIAPALRAASHESGGVAKRSALRVLYSYT